MASASSSSGASSSKLSVKVAILGPRRVGCTSLMCAMSTEGKANGWKYDAATAIPPTVIGVDFRVHRVEERDLRVLIWDRDPCPSFRNHPSSVMRSSIRGAAVVIVVFSLSDPATLAEIPDIILQIRSSSADVGTRAAPGSILLVGNKADQNVIGGDEVVRERLRAMGIEDLSYMATSALTGTGVCEVFEVVSRHVGPDALPGGVVLPADPPAPSPNAGSRCYR